MNAKDFHSHELESGKLLVEWPVIGPHNVIDEVRKFGFIPLLELDIGSLQFLLDLSENDCGVESLFLADLGERATATRWPRVRKYSVPAEIAGVAMQLSFNEFTASTSYSGPARTMCTVPSSLVK